MKAAPYSFQYRVAAFTLVELLVVVAIMIVLAALVVPAFNQIAIGTNLTRGGQIIGDQIALARQEAVTRNRNVEVRFYNLKNGDPKSWRGVQVWRDEQTVAGATSVPVGKMELIPDDVLINADPALTPLLSAATLVSGTGSSAIYGSTIYHGFLYRSNGSTESTLTDANNYLTLQNINATNPPKNYYTIQINPITGKVTVFRRQ